MKAKVFLRCAFLLTLLDVLVRSPTPVVLADTSHCGTVGSDETWDSSGNVHRITCDVTVPVGVTLTVEEGVIVKFDIGRSLIVQGALRVLGAESDAVYFTSIRDDTVGGDTNGDGASSLPARGNWSRIQFGENSDDANCLIDHAVVAYGSNEYYGYHGAIELLSASPTIQNSTIRDSLYYAYRADLDSFPTLTNNTLVNNGINGLALTDDTYGSVLNTDATWDIIGTTYYLRNDVSIGSDRTLTVAPGVVVKFGMGRSLLVNGNNSALRALGTASDPVYFTSMRDDTVGGDTNNDGASSLPARGNWSRIQFGENSDDANCLIDRAVVAYGSNESYGYHGAIELLSASPTIQNSTIRDSLYYGILANNSTPVLGCNNIHDNGGLNHGIRYYGLYNATTNVLVHAEHQWWGSTSGPYHAMNPDGTSNAVSDGVAFDPWRTSPCGGPPAAPSGLQATATSSEQIDVTWKDNSADETEFRIERSGNGVSGWTEIGSVAKNVTQYSDTGLVCSTKNYYRVRSFRESDGAYSTYSNVASATTKGCYQVYLPLVLRQVR
jgi:hypothetical protein